MSTTRLAGRPPSPDYHHLNSSSIVMSAVEKLDAAETGRGSIKDEPKTGGGLKLIVIGMLIGTFLACWDHGADFAVRATGAVSGKMP